MNPDSKDSKPKVPDVSNDPHAREAAEREQAALDNVREGYGRFPAASSGNDTAPAASAGRTPAPRTRKRSAGP